MAVSTLTGTRVRERRLALGIRQADLARAAEVSASYLNLIEHNRRRIGAPVLARLAAALGIEPQALEEGAPGRVQEGLRAAAAEWSGGVLEAAARPAGPSMAGLAAARPGPPPELDRIDDFAGRFPGWAGVVAGQQARIAELERAVHALNDRMTHDPHLSQALHEVLSAVSSVRSTAAILAETEDIAPDWRERFHANIHADSERLAVGAEALVAYLDSSTQEEQGIAAPLEEVEAWLAARGWDVAPDAVASDPARGPAGAPWSLGKVMRKAREQRVVPLPTAPQRGLDEVAIPAAIEAEIAAIASAAARSMARAWARRALAEAAALPRPALEAALAEGLDAGRIAARFGLGVLPVFRRLALRDGSDIGLVICDASGTLVFRKPASGFALPRFGAACPLWPLYAALARPSTPVIAWVETTDRLPRRYRVEAWCELTRPGGFAGPELREAAMLILPEDGPPPPGADLIRIGTSCRICPRDGCEGRREPSILTEAV